MGGKCEQSYMCMYGGSDVNKSAHDAGDLGLIPGSERLPWRRKWLSTPVFLPGEHGERNLVSYSKHSVSFIVKEIKIKGTLKYHFSSLNCENEKV